MFPHKKDKIKHVGFICEILMESRGCLHAPLEPLPRCFDRAELKERARCN